MHCNPHLPQIAHAKHATDDIAAQVVENKNFPYRIAVCGQNGCRRREEPVGMGFVAITCVDDFVQIQDLLERRWKLQLVCGSHLKPDSELSSEKGTDRSACRAGNGPA